MTTLVSFAALEDDLTAYWTFDNTLADEAENISGSASTANNSLTFTGSGSTYGTGRFGSGGYLGVGTGQAEAGDHADLDPSGSTISVSLWFKVTSFNTNWQAALSKGETTSYRFQRHNNTNTIAWKGAAADIYNGSVNVNDGAWHHVVGTATAANSRLYIDGVLVASDTGGSLAGSSNPLMIGNNPDATNRRWNGEIDDVAIWHREITSAEVTQIYSAATALGDLMAPDPMGDPDGDGLTNAVETNTGTFIDQNDTGTDPNLADTDGDGLHDGTEVITYSTLPTVADTDMDGANDGLEVLFGTDPNNINDTPPAGSAMVGISSPGTIGPYLDNVLPSLTPSVATGENWQVEDAFSASGLTFADLKGVVAEPNSTYIAVIERQGTIQRVNVSDLSSATLSKQQTLNIGSLTVNGDNGGLRSVVFHPEYNMAGSPNRNYMYCFYSTTASTSRGFSSNNGAFFYRVSRFTRNETTGNFTFGSELVLIQQRSRDHGQHFGGGLVFDSDGFLNISWGDMEFNESRVGVPFYQDAQRIDRIFQAAVLRIDVDNQGGTVSQAPTRTLQGNTGPNAVSGTSQSCSSSHHYYHVDNFSGVSYMIPKDNFFLNNPPPPGDGTSWSGTPVHGAPLDEHQALGVRNPWRMTVDAVDGHIAMFNVGSNAGADFEEVEILSPGANYGWPYREGTTSQTSETGRSKPPSQYGPTYVGTETDAAAFWAHPDGGTVAVGGAFYHGSLWPQLTDHLVFADHSTGKIWALDYKSAGTPSGTRATTDGVSVPSNYSVRLLVDTDRAIRQMTSGPVNGKEIFIAANGRIYRLFNSAAANPEAPALLSQTGAFTDLATMTPRAGLLPYTPASKLWSDRAVKQRWIAVPNNAGTPGAYDTAAEKISYSADGEWQFPNGTVFVKHFTLPTDLTDPDNPAHLKPIETRFLVRGSDGTYFYFTYEWNAAGTDANLLISGTTADFDITDEAGSPAMQTWTYPSRANCADCHQTGAGSVLGMKSRQMNHPQLYPSTSITANQITTFAGLDLFDSSPDFADLPSALKSVDINDTSQTLELRVRSYLDSNCSFCHRPESNADRAVFDALLTTPLNLSGIVNGTPEAGNLGVTGAEIVKPGSSSKSILYLRDSATDSNRMPPIGRSLNDPNYVPVLKAWIERLGYTEFDSWATAGNVAGGLSEDDDGDGVNNVIEFFLGMNGLNGDLSSMPHIMDPGVTDPEIKIPISGAALTDGFALVVEGSSDLVNWYTAGDPQSGLTVVSDTSSPGTSGEMHIRFIGPVRSFIRYGVVIP